MDFFSVAFFSAAAVVVSAIYGLLVTRRRQVNEINIMRAWFMSIVDYQSFIEYNRLARFGVLIGYYKVMIVN